MVSDLRITAGDGTPLGQAIRVASSEAFETDSGSVTASFNVTLSAPSDGSVKVDYQTVEAAATAGTDFTPLTGTLTFPAGSTQLNVNVAVLGDNLEEEDEDFFLRLFNPRGAALADALGTATIFDDDLRLGPVEGQERTYSLDEDFDLGRLFNVHHDAPHGDQLQLTAQFGPFPFIWIAASARGTLVKIDTRTGAILGEVSTTPDNRDHNPSRTTVALDGSVWAGNRNDGSVIHVGLVEEGQCIDRNGNGVIETSNGYGNVLAWPNPGGIDTGGGVKSALDECILHYVKVAPSIPRHVSINGDGNVWVSGWAGSNQSVFQLLDGRSGQILRTDGPHPCGGYGGLVDGDGIVWSASLDGPVLRWDPRVVPPTATSRRCVGSGTIRAYGMAIAPSGDIYVSRSDANRLYRIDKDTLAVTTLLNHGSSCAQGLAVDENQQVWVSSARFCATTTVGHVNGKTGSFIGNVTGVPSGSTGVAIDGAGKVWVASDNASRVARINPNAGPLGAAKQIAAPSMPSSPSRCRPRARPKCWSTSPPSMAALRLTATISRDPCGWFSRREKPRCKSWCRCSRISSMNPTRPCTSS